MKVRIGRLSDNVRRIPLYREDPDFRHIVDTYRDADKAAALSQEHHFLYVGYLIGVIERLTRQGEGS